MDRKILIAALMVVIIAAGASLVVFGGDDDHDNERDPHTITVKDSLGNDVTLTVPLTKICTVNTNAAEFIHMFGADKIVVGADNACIKSLNNIYGDVTDIGDYKTPSGEVITSTGATIVISQSSSRSLSAETEQALKDNYNIRVLRLDCYGETMMSDIETLASIIDTDKAEKKLAEYKTAYKNVVDAVMTKASAAAKDPSFLAMFTSNNKFYNSTSELGKIIESIGGHHVLTAIGDKPKTVASAPAAEKLYNYGNSTGVDLVLIRGISGESAESCYQKFLKYGGTYDFSKLKKGESSDIFVIETDVLSGARDYIGYVCIAEAMGIDTGMDYDQMVKDFNTKYGFDVTHSYIMKQFP